MPHHVILGAGPAGVTAAETLRAADRNAKITIVAGEGADPYSRMAIPYFLQGHIKEQGTHLRQVAGHYKSAGIDIAQARAGGIDTRDKKLFLAGGGETLAYDRLLIATGASPILPPIEGVNLPGVHTCWTLADAREIVKLTGKGVPVVLVGAGFIGSIILEALHASGARLTVVELAPRMVARMMDDTAGGMMKRWCEAKGVKVLTNTKVTRISQVANGVGDSLSVETSGNQKLEAKLVVLAVGVRSNTGFLVGSDIKAERGIRVGRFLETSAPDVYAAGDCCEATDISTGGHDVLAVQPVAVEHGRIAALNMAGRPTAHRGSLNMNVLDTMGLISSSFGLWDGKPGGETSKLLDEKANKYLKLNFDGDRLVGAQSLGLTEHVGMLRGLIQTGLRLGDWKKRLMAAPERVNEAYVALAQGSPVQGWAGPRPKLPVG
jgi:NAD(P)H-nitrite reductase large subunit